MIEILAWMGATGLVMLIWLTVLNSLKALIK